MFIMGVNSWESDMPKKSLVFFSLKFAEDVKTQGIAELQEAFLAFDEKQLWCTWKTENLEALQAAFDEMNKQTGLVSQLLVAEKYYPK
jgi:hypothetical protein